MKKIVFILALFLFLGFLVRVEAATFRLKDGSTISGEVIRQDEEGVTLKVSYGEIFIAHQDITSQSSKKNVKSKKSSSQKVQVVNLRDALPLGERLEKQYYKMKYMIYFPTTFEESGRFPMIVAIDPSGHGHPHLNLWEEHAEQNGIVVVAPYAVKPGQWELEDFETVRNLTKGLVRKYKINPRKVFATGFSGGGVFAYRLAIENPDVFKKVATVCSPLMNIHSSINFPKNRKIPVLIITGSTDQLAGTDSSFTAYTKLKKKGYKAVYHEIAGMGHESRKEDNLIVMRFFNIKAKS